VRLQLLNLRVRSPHIGLALALAVAGPAGATDLEGPPAATRVVVAGAPYGAGGLHAFLFGRGYRDVWTVPIEVAALDLDTFEGGLTVTDEGDRGQSRGVRLRDAAGRRYTFQSTGTDLRQAMPEALRGRALQALAQDQTASQLPAGVLVVDSLLDAAGVRHLRSHLFVLGDSARLGSWRSVFAGRLGTLEDVLDEERPGAAPGFEDAVEMAESPALFKKILASASETVDARAYLRARLMDVLIGDWDRRPRHWQWVRRGADRPWEPVPLDRDQAFCRYHGLVLALGRGSTGLPLTTFGARYEDLLRLTWTGLDMDRLLLARLAWPAWESVTRDLALRLTDSVIEGAVGRLPPEYVRLRGAFLVRALKSRRDALPAAARDFYRLLSREARVTASDDPERAEITRTAEGLTLRVRVKPDGPVSFARTFVPRETKEVRLFLGGGDDDAIVRGHGPIKLRVVGGPGRNRLDDSGGGHTRFYDSGPGDEVRPGPGTHVDTRPYDDVLLPAEAPPRDWAETWGMPVWVDLSGDTGLFLGAGLSNQRYSFRKQPYASYHRLRVGYAFGPGKWRADYLGELRRVASPLRVVVRAYASGIEVLRFYGFGNATKEQADDDFHKTDQQQYLFSPKVEAPLAPSLTVSAGPRLQYVDTPARSDRLIGIERPYGVGRFGALAAQADVDWHRRDRSAFPRPGFWASAGGSLTPALWSVTRTYGEVHGQAGVAATVAVPFASTFVARVGGTRISGPYPFFDAAFLGGGGDDPTVRGLRAYRYAGDARAYGNGEWRVPVARLTFLVPADVGVLAFADIGRVFLAGESSARWHSGLGGGVWVAPIEHHDVIMLTAARAEGRTAVQLRVGFAF
jgi:hypothetical protein